MSDDKNNEKPSLFKKMIAAGESILDAQIHKARTSITMNTPTISDDELFLSKTVTADPNKNIGSQGWKEKHSRLNEGHLKQMSLKNTIASAIIQTRQNQISKHSKYVTSEQETGWMIKLVDEDRILNEIIEELKKEIEIPETEINTENMMELENSEEVKAEPSLVSEKIHDQQINEWEILRKAKDILKERYQEDIYSLRQYIENCGKLENRPFDSEKWNFDSALRVWTRDTLTYSRICTEIIPDRLNRPHHFIPVDSGTIKYLSNHFKGHKNIENNSTQIDILYPEKEADIIETTKKLEIKDDLLEKNMYKYAQVINGRIERVYTADEMKFSVRNLTTDLYNNGYGVSELELAMTLITGHLNAEFYNQSYFTQGFSAKGILHIKSQISRRKMETVRQQWQHMLKGVKNSFQTPIFAGVDDVSWIPLTQRHEDIGFEGWMRYLVKMICAIYQIDPHEIGIGFKDEGSGGSLSTGDSTKEKMKASKDKGLYPLLRHLETYINKNIIAPYDSRFQIVFTGVTGEDKNQVLQRQKEEVKFKKTVNEIRAEDGLPPLPGMDNVILSNEYMQWYSKFSEEAKKMNEEMMALQTPGGIEGQDEDLFSQENVDESVYSYEPEDIEEQSLDDDMEKSYKLLTVDYYKMDE